MAHDPSDDLRLDQFCALFAFGTPIPSALREAGYDVHSVSFGFNLMRGAAAQAKIDQHRRWIAEKVACSINEVVQQLDRDRELAWKTENPAAAVSATMAKAKLLGFMDQSVNTPKRIIIEWQGDSDGVPQAA